MDIHTDTVQTLWIPGYQKMGLSELLHSMEFKRGKNESGKDWQETGQENDNTLYKLYLWRERMEENLLLLQWLRSHTVVRNKAKVLGSDKFLVTMKFVSVHNPAFFFQHLLLHHPHRQPAQLRHLEEATMLRVNEFFAQAIALCPRRWTTSQQILSQFKLEGDCSSYLTTLVAFVQALHDMFLW